MNKSRKQYLRERFKETYGRVPEELLNQDSISERDLEVALRLENNKLASIALIIQAEEALEDIDEDHISQETKEDIRSTKAKIRFSKNVESARYGMPWERIRDLFLTGQHEVLEEEYTEDWDAEDLLRANTESKD